MAANDEIGEAGVARLARSLRRTRHIEDLEVRKEALDDFRV